MTGSNEPKTKSLYRGEAVSLYFSLIIDGKVLGRMSLSEHRMGFFLFKKALLLNPKHIE